MWWMEVCLSHGMVLGSLANPSCGRWRGGWDCHKPVRLESSKIEPSRGLIYWGSKNNVDDIVYFCGNCCSGGWDYFIIGEHLLPSFLQGMIERFPWPSYGQLPSFFMLLGCSSVFNVFLKSWISWLGCWWCWAWLVGKSNVDVAFKSCCFWNSQLPLEPVSHPEYTVSMFLPNVGIFHPYIV